jgi:hypothetical protein
MITIKHNLNSAKFKWLWAKYVRGVNLTHHCTNSLKGPYSKKFSKLNVEFNSEGIVTFDECSHFKAIYICGVSVNGYSKKLNYPDNLHLVLVPEAGRREVFKFLNWEFEVTNAKLSSIIGEDELAPEYKDLPKEYTTCRIFRWACSEGSSITN